MSGVAFVDIETTGLDPDRHEIWEVALIDGKMGGEHVWHLPVDLGRADAKALEISGWYDNKHERQINPVEPFRFAEEFEELTRGQHLAGAVVSFDEERLRKFLRVHGACPAWHYHLIDVEILAVGYLNGRRQVHVGPGAPELPWTSDLLSELVGVDPEKFDRHTALGDARWAKAIYEAVTG